MRDFGYSWTTDWKRMNKHENNIDVITWPTFSVEKANHLTELEDKREIQDKVGKRKFIYPRNIYWVPTIYQACYRNGAIWKEFLDLEIRFFTLLQ